MSPLAIRPKAFLPLGLLGLSLSLVLVDPFSLSAAEAPQVSLNRLIEEAASYHGKEVTVEGEVVGDVMLRGSYGWLNLSDGSAVLGVWGPAELLRQVRTGGGYWAQGDRVRVRGIFWRADPRQGGELDLQATALEVVARGRAREHPVTAPQFLRAAFSLAAAAALALAWSRRREGGKEERQVPAGDGEASPERGEEGGRQ
ncbi:MAG: OB-fold nucleic acid binding domain-containing protein [Bacillota bacterium]|nr:OB-fold nucleic acid binding domain-containing protein [Bacillota bacterium]